MIKRTILTLAAFSPMAACSAPVPNHQQVIELYQSQGCSSCPPANAVLNGLADRKDLLTLSFSVTYWDYLGWKDRFATPAFTQRQYDYAAGAHRQGVQTPQMIINGRGFINGVTQAEVGAALSRYARTAPEPDIAATPTAVTVGAGQGRGTVWLVRYNPGTLDVPISAGENTGRTLPHRHIVRDLIRLGDWHGAAASFPRAAAPTGLAEAILVQDGKGGPIVAARGL
ncbi:DUF1223 domain-containing protein [Asticcacaulis solisilvae]|uniref:DUF1223 domain-containing protein n=1 Tax=Asticcacaulis solisilvae TaxID=1217274 RepID=UPI003FD765BA